MRATTLVTSATLVTLVTLTAAAPTTPDTAPLLLVLRSACHSNDSSIFSEEALKNFMVSSKRDALLSRPFQILSYKDTCGVKSDEWIARAGLASVASGGAVVSAGWPGRAACGALTAAARVVSRRATPAACAEQPARAAVLALLARRLHWRLALLQPPRDTSDQCTVVIDEVERALLAAGLLVRRASPDIENIKPYVSILCDDQYNSKQANKLKQGNNIGSMLILRSSSAPSPASAPAPAPAPASTATSPLHTRNLKIVNIASDLDPYDKTSPSPTSYARFSHKNQVDMSQRSLSEPTTGDYLLQPRGLKRRKLVDLFNTNTLNSFGLDPDEYLYSLLLTDFNNETSTYDELMKVLQSHYDKTEIVNNMFQLFESKVIDGSPRWVRVSIFKTKSIQSTDHNWHTDVSWEGHGDFDVWCSEHTAPSIMETYQTYATRAVRKVQEAASAVCVAGAALVALAAIALTIIATRRSLAKRMQRRPRAAVILLAADFQFPVDEQRRVGEGMESMLSWLQQLHDLNGPQSNKPDLLKRPTAPSAPSAPSSTCSVTRLPPDGRIRYKGDPVHMKYFPAASLELKRKAIDVLLVMQSLRHENLNPFIGCLCSVRPALVFEVCGRGSLEDVLVADEIRLDWTFRLSLLTDLVRGMRYLHASPLRLHGRLSSRNCVIDSRWVLRVTDYGLGHVAHAQPLPTASRSARELLWCAPEILRVGDAAQGTQAGDVFSFSIIMQEVIVRGEPYCMLSLSPEEIVEKLCHPPPLIRPSVSMGAAPPEAVSVMRQCWSEQPDLRPDFNRLYDIFRHLHRGRKVNIVDSMFEMLEKYSNNLEELIKERTEQLDIEKKKTEQLLNRMLPRSVAERLMLGLRVQPEEFEEVSIYFSDIVGFTAIAARSTPVQVVDLLNDLYTTFDATIEQYRVYKVETIGDAYMVVGGLPLRCTDHAESIATMALHLLHLAGRFRIRHSPGTPLHLRIGLHTGPCCAGVVGLTMPRYCLFGDTVNTASRMESTGAAWRVQVSNATAERLTAAGGYRLRSRGLTQVKGKGAMHTYWLLGKEGFEKPLPTPPPLESEEVLFETECENDSECSDQSTPGFRTAHVVERHPSDPGTPSSGHTGWRLNRSGAVSADSSPPALPARGAASAARYRYMRASLSTCSVAGEGLSAPQTTSGARVLRRQWSLERGDVLAAAAAGTGTADAPAVSDSTLEPLALRAPPPRPAPPRYRTRIDVSHSHSGDSER